MRKKCWENSPLKLKSTQLVDCQRLRMSFCQVSKCLLYISGLSLGGWLRHQQLFPAHLQDQIVSRYIRMCQTIPNTIHMWYRFWFGVNFDFGAIHFRWYHHLWPCLKNISLSHASNNDPTQRYKTRCFQ